MNRGFVLKSAAAVVAAYLTHLLGGFDKAMEILIIFIVLDYLTGLLAAWYTKSLDSKVGLRGIARKVAMLALVIVAHQVDLLVGTNGVTRTAVIYFLVANDGLSILENLGECGLSIPSVLSDALAKMKKQGDTSERVDSGKQA